MCFFLLDAEYASWSDPGKKVTIIELFCMFDMIETVAVFTSKSVFFFINMSVSLCFLQEKRVFKKMLQSRLTVHT